MSVYLSCGKQTKDEKSVVKLDFDSRGEKAGRKFSSGHEPEKWLKRLILRNI